VSEREKMAREAMQRAEGHDLRPYAAEYMNYDPKEDVRRVVRALLEAEAELGRLREVEKWARVVSEDTRNVDKAYLPEWQELDAALGLKSTWRRTSPDAPYWATRVASPTGEGLEGPGEDEERENS
jgi:hypothetical protein